MLNCSQPDQPALLEALRPVFNLRSIRPVMNLSTPTFVSIDFTVFAILGVVRDATLTYNLSLIIHQISSICFAEGVYYTELAMFFLRDSTTQFGSFDLFYLMY